MDYAYQIRSYMAALRLRDTLSTHGFHHHPTEEQWAHACGTTVQQLQRLITEGRQARAALISANTGLVVHMAQRHYAALQRNLDSQSVGTILTLSDLIQEGTVGLVTAAEKYCPDRGCKFSTYATYWIRERLARSVADSSRSIRLPVHVHSILSQLRAVQRQYWDAHGQAPSVAYLARAVQLSPAKVQWYLEQTRNVLSLERPVTLVQKSGSDASSVSLWETLASDTPTPEEDAAQESLQQHVRSVVQTALTAEERAVVQLRYGLDSSNAPEALTTTATAQVLGWTRDRVRRVESKALARLRQHQHQLHEYVGGKPAPKRNNNSMEGSTTRSSVVSAASPDRLWFF